jgi:Fe-S-cluster containining protein
MNGNGHSEKDGIFIMPSLEASVWCILFTELTEKCEINELRPKVAASEPCDVGGR